MTKDDLLEQLREHGIEDLSRVKKCFIESDGKLSVIQRDDSQQQPKPKDSMK